MNLAYSSVGGAFMLFSMLYFRSSRACPRCRRRSRCCPHAHRDGRFQHRPKLGQKFRPGYVIAAGGIGVAIVMLSFLGSVPTTAPGDQSSGSPFCPPRCADHRAGHAARARRRAGREKAGSAGSLVQLSTEFGGTLGIAVIGTIGTAVYRGQIADHIPAGSRARGGIGEDSLAGATEVAASCRHRRPLRCSTRHTRVREWTAHRRAFGAF